MKITIELSDLDELAMRHDLLDPEEWVRTAVAMKILPCRERMDAEAIRVLTADPKVEAIPARQDDRLLALSARPDYRNRAARDKADEEAMQKRIAEAEAAAKAETARAAKATP